MDGPSSRSGDLLLACEYWGRRVTSGQMTPGSAARYVRVLESFVRFCTAHGCSSFAEVGSDLCLRFIYAARATGEPPAASTSRFRLTVVRDAYFGLAMPADPTAGLSVLQPKAQARPVPLTPTEVHRLRHAGRVAPRDHLRPTTVLLALLGAQHLEIAEATVSDVDLRQSSVRLGVRQVSVDTLGASTLAARIAACRRQRQRLRQPWDPSSIALSLRKPLSTYPPTSVAPSVSSSLSRALTAAGLTRPGLRPRSLREYAASHHYALTGRAEDVATLLGITSLDVAMSLISADWQERYGEEVRELDC